MLFHRCSSYRVVGIKRMASEAKKEEKETGPAETKAYHRRKRSAGIVNLCLGVSLLVVLL
jgi:hypothetical protein